MIKEIKQALADAEMFGPSLTHHEWLVYLIGEVERLSMEIRAVKITSSVHEGNRDMYEKSSEMYQRKTKKLQKALEMNIELATLELDYEGSLRILGQISDFSRTALGKEE